MGVIFLNNRKTPWSRRTLGQQLLRMKARDEVSTVATLHGVRHQFASEAVKNGASLKAVSLQLGHADIAITSKMYVHLDGDTDFMREAAELAMPKKTKDKP